jgi:predicted AAA+ superfamily ATPase
MENNTIIKRRIESQVLQRLIPGQVVILYGARRVGKTTLINSIISQLSGKIKLLNGENSLHRDEISSDNFYRLKQLLADYEYLIIDEAQKINSIGQILKIIVDNVEHIKILVSGSASFELANQVGEPLTGRKKTLTLFPLSVSEIYDGGELSIKERTEELLIFGSYPKIFTSPSEQDKKEELMELVDSYLYKDILELQQVRNSGKIRNLLTLLAFQVGSTVSLNELSGGLGIHVNTVAHYLDLLEKVFVIYKVGAFSRNLRKEVSKSCKYYFFDNGIRNALINNFNRLNLRDDMGKLWENFIMTERMKFLGNERIFANRYFWRTYDQKEIDLIEERDAMLYGYEFKYGKGKVKMPNWFLATYKNSSFEIVNEENYVDFLTRQNL